MTPKEKALDLAIKFSSPLAIVRPNIASKRCALIAVDEIMNFIKEADYAYIEDDIDYLQEVKQELERL